MGNYEIKKKADQTSDKNTFQVLDTKPLTNANNDASGSKQEDNDDAIPSMSSALMLKMQNQMTITCSFKI